jgi:putative acetyltransferase
MEIIFRGEQSSDEEGIRHVNDLAFKQPKEGKLIDLLRKKPAFEKQLSIVAELEGIIAGHVLFFPIHINDGKKLHLSLSLAPIAVMPKYQKKGIGLKLIEEGHKVARELDFSSVLVIGHPEYYPKAGYSKASGFGIQCPFPAPDEAFMAIELIDGALQDIKGMGEFPPEYLEV